MSRTDTDTWLIQDYNNKIQKQYLSVSNCKECPMFLMLESMLICKSDGSLEDNCAVLERIAKGEL